MKRFFALILALLLALGCLGCNSDPAPTVTTEPAPTNPTASAEAKAALDGKKILFVGNSYTYFGNAVIQDSLSVKEQTARENDQGYFYQLCKAMGIEVNVTDWTFGAHDLTDSLGTACARDNCAGANHIIHMLDKKFDYVVLQPYYERAYTGDLDSHLKPFLDMFREANPDVKFILAVPYMTYDRNYVWLGSLETMDRSDILICNWGKMCRDVAIGAVEVPGATQEYGRPTFIVSVDEKDGHHQNLLAGYLTSAMIYCAVTGESAVGLPYAFCDDASLNPKFDMDTFKEQKYVYEPYTNFVEVYRSAADMNGLQQLIDQYLAAENS